ncbi:hypothetical protein HK096_009349 [Nowakowskiella sp. JEL0078]|nr:hypothetical protein HK096_009349 [Nowakowskiella sp. JEL0078]
MVRPQTYAESSCSVAYQRKPLMIDHNSIYLPKNVIFHEDDEVSSSISSVIPAHIAHEPIIPSAEDNMSESDSEEEESFTFENIDLDNQSEITNWRNEEEETASIEQSQRVEVECEVDGNEEEEEESESISEDLSEHIFSNTSARIRDLLRTINQGLMSGRIGESRKRQRNIFEDDDELGR